MFNRSSFLSQDHRPENQHVNNSSSYDGNHHQSATTSNFYTHHQNNSNSTLPEYVHHIFPNAEHNDWRVENSGVATLSLTEESPRENSTNSTRLQEIYETNDPRENSTNSTRLQEIYETNDIEELTNHVRRKLIKTGQMERLNELVERRLSEVGWRLDMMAYSRTIVKKHGDSITFEKLFQELKACAKEKVPEEVQTEVMQKIKYCYESAIPSED